MVYYFCCILYGVTVKCSVSSRGGGMADARDLKSLALKGVRVRLPLPARTLMIAALRLSGAGPRTLFK